MEQDSSVDSKTVFNMALVAARFRVKVVLVCLADATDAADANHPPTKTFGSDGRLKAFVHV
jgi:hypothetical protein